MTNLIHAGPKSQPPVPYLVDVVTKRQGVQWKITPKGSGTQPVVQLPILMPYFLIIASSAIATFFHPQGILTTGYSYLSVFNILTYVGLLATILACHRAENPPPDSKNSLISNVPLPALN